MHVLYRGVDCLCTDCKDPPDLQESMVMRVAYERKSARWKELTDAVSYFIAKDSLPVYMIEKSGFTQLMNI